MNRQLFDQNASLLIQVLRVTDAAIVVIAGIGAYAFHLGPMPPPANYVIAILAVALAAVLVFPLFGTYLPHRGMSVVVEIRALCYGWLTIALAWAVFLFATQTGIQFSRLFAGYWMVGGLALCIALRVLLRAMLHALRRRGRNLRTVCIVGAGTHGRDVAARMRSAAWAGLALRGYYDDDLAKGTLVDGVPVLGRCDQIAPDFVSTAFDQVWIALPLRAEETLLRVLDDLRDTTAQVRYVPDIHGFHLLHHSFTEIAGLPVLNLTDSPFSGGGGALKALEDYLLSTLLLLASMPVWLLIAIGVKLSSPGPVFYRQERVTWNGEHFRMLKFRTMPVDAEAHTGPVWSAGGERRATRFGAFLRRTSLDELPQFINVLKGEMSLVGPRPERPEFVEQFRRRIPGYMQKHLVKAGITGWAQVNDLRGDTDLARRIQYDLYYIDRWSLWFDLRILALTLWHILTSRNAR